MKVNEALKRLEQNPLFQLSLGSKELFHSNFLSWIIGNKGQKVFVLKFLNDLLGLESRIETIIELPEREKMNIDLRFKVSQMDGTKRLIIIENKVKSLPYAKQLNDYKEKVEKENKKKDYEVSYYLLSLVEPMFELKDWKLISYGDVAKAMTNSVDKLQAKESSLVPLDRMLTAYIHFITQLDEIASSDLKIKDPENELFDYVDSDIRKEYETLRLHDLYLKSKHQQIAALIKQDLVEDYDQAIDFDFNPSYHLGKNNKKLVKSENSVVIEENFTRGNAIIDFKFLPKTFTLNDTDFHYTFCLQLQGSDLRFGLQFMGKFEGPAKLKAKQLIYRIANKLFDSEEWMMLPNGLKIDENVFDSKKLTGTSNKVSDYDKERRFCSFGDLFLFKYYKIPPTTKIQDIIDIYKKVFAQLYENKSLYIDILNESRKELDL